MSRSRRSTDIEYDIEVEVDRTSKSVIPSRGTTSFNKPSQGPYLYTTFEDKVRRYIDLIDELRRQGLNEEFDLPAVVVIGDQSSGKSSILEAISGVALPRGSGIQTRCPLEMQLKKSQQSNITWKGSLKYKDAADKIQEHCINDSNDVEDMVRQAQIDMTDDELGISKNVITLNIESPKCPDLTLIDLPGIARVPMEGQPQNICDQTKDIILEFIKKPEAIILCVAPAEVDLTCNEAIVIARSVDPDGLRTLAVITKPDLKDRGTEEDIIEIMKNKKLPMKMGYRIVRCRGQQEINNKIDLETALNQEDQFFEEHRIYRKIDPELRGTKHLAEKLSDILVTHIKTYIPRLRNEVRRRIETTSAKLDQVGDAPPEDTVGKRLYFINAAKKFCDQMTDIMNNQLKIPTTVVPRIKATTPSKMVTISFLWRKCFVDLKSKVEVITEENFNSGSFQADKIQQKMLSYRGNALPGFVDFELFEDLVREHCLQYEAPSFDCLAEISSDLMMIMAYVSEQCLAHIPSVKENIRGICESVHKSCKDEGRRLLNLEMKKERLVFSQDATYLEQLRKSMDSKQELNYQVYNGDNDITKHNAVVMRELLQVYLNIANRRISDSVPMLLRSTQYDEFIKMLKETINRVASDETTETLIQEDTKLTSKRTELLEKLRRLDEAMRMLNRQ